MENDDRQLVERIKAGDGESFGVLYDRTRDWLLSFVIVPRVGAAEAEDVLAETFQVAVAGIRKFEWRGISVLHWLSAIARRKAQERLRRRREALDRDTDLTALFDLPDDVPTAEAEMIRQERLIEIRERVGATLAGIAPRYAEALRLRLLEGRARQECADELGVTAATFDVVLHRATRAFAREWRKS
jgi:RNA polymerase sigma factor (sigma-70 family)